LICVGLFVVGPGIWRWVGLVPGVLFLLVVASEMAKVFKKRG
jgi:hypothetical protein